MTRGEHIRQLCKQLRITRLISPGRGRADCRHRRIKAPPLSDSKAYFITLHEIGHVVIGLQPPRRLDREALAWEWALANSIEPPSTAVKQMICANLVRYALRADVRGWGRPGVRFLRLLEWWR